MIDNLLYITAWMVIVFMLIRLGVSLVNLFSPLYLQKPPGGGSSPKKISVLIPARNEAGHLPGLLDDLLKQSYPDFEIMVYDDHSDDNTPDILFKYSQRDARMSWVRGEALPEGWTGKNHACYQLARKAKGDVFLFLDADVSVSPDLLEKAAWQLERHRLSLLSIFPHQVLKSRGEWLTVPLMNWILLSLLPMILVRKSKRPSFAAANGQFMMFDAASYRHNQWHQQVKASLVEDIEINRIMKAGGYRTETLLGNNDIKCRMYRSLKEGIHGFSKNVIEFFGGSVILAILFVMLVTAGVVLIPVFFGWWWFLYYILAVACMRIFISIRSKQNLWKNLLLHIPQMMVFILLVFRGVRVRLKGDYQWKGRKTGVG